MKEKVEANWELAFLSRELATIVLDIPFDENFEDMQGTAPDGAALAPLLEELEFRTLSRRLLGDTATPIARLPAATAAPAAAASGDDSEGQLSMFDAAMEVALRLHPVFLDESKVNYTLALAPAAWAEVRTLAEAGRFAFDTETTGLDAMAAIWWACPSATKPAWPPTCLSTQSRGQTLGGVQAFVGVAA